MILKEASHVKDASATESVRFDPPPLSPASESIKSCYVALNRERFIVLDFFGHAGRALEDF